MKVRLTIVVVLILVCGGAARADFTNIFDPPSSEKSHVDILNQIYGGGFTPTWSSPGAVSYTNGTITATRIDDYGRGGLLHLVFGAPGSADDQIWTDGKATITVEAKFTGYSQQFGYDSGSGYTKLFDVIGDGFSVTGSETVTFPHGSTWQWVRSGTGGNWYSNPANNSDGLDHMVTYQVGGLGDGCTTTWLVFWEDLEGPHSKWGSDRDFNDLVVEIKGSHVPAPSAILLGGIGVAIVNWLRRRRTL